MYVNCRLFFTNAQLFCACSYSAATHMYVCTCTHRRTHTFLGTSERMCTCPRTPPPHTNIRAAPHMYIRTCTPHQRSSMHTYTYTYIHAAHLSTAATYVHVPTSAVKQLHTYTYVHAAHPQRSSCTRIHTCMHPTSAKLLHMYTY